MCGMWSFVPFGMFVNFDIFWGRWWCLYVWWAYL
jgi:hypothetical protein